MVAADKIFYNGQIYTMDDDESICEAVAVYKDKILCTGDVDTITEYKGNDSLFINLNGKTVLPGLGDAHLHASSTCELLFSFNMYNINLPYDTDPENALKKYKDIIGENLAAHHDTTIIRGTGWDPGYFMQDPKTMPTASDIDCVCNDIPIILRSYDHHYVWVNSKVLKDSGITKDTPDPRNGIIWRDENGEPTGVFQENSAIEYLLSNLSYGDYTVDEYEKGILHYQKNFGNSYGTMLIFDALATENAITAYKNLAFKNLLTMRVATVYTADPAKPMSQFDDILRRYGSDNIDGIFYRSTLKIFVDGTGLSIYMDKPYEEDYLKSIGMEKGYRGYSQWSEDELREIFTKINGAGIPIHAHCMGDGATKITLDAMEYAKSQGVPVEKMRNTIAHFMAIREEDKLRMAQLKVIANVQPIWGCRYSMTDTILTDTLGKKRALSQYPLKSFKTAGVTMAAGTDFPVIIPPSPFLGFKIGITRTVNKDHPEYDQYADCPLGPEENPMLEAVSLKDMIKMYSQGAAYQTFFDDIMGSIEPGKSADFVILDQRITDADDESMDSIKAESVYFKGIKIF